MTTYANIAPQPTAHDALRAVMRDSIHSHRHDAAAMMALLNEDGLTWAYTSNGSYHDVQPNTQRLIDEALNRFISEKYESIDKLRATIAELDHVDACNAAIRAAGY